MVSSSGAHHLMDSGSLGDLWPSPPIHELIEAMTALSAVWPSHHQELVCSMARGCAFLLSFQQCDVAPLHSDASPEANNPMMLCSSAPASPAAAGAPGQIEVPSDESEPPQHHLCQAPSTPGVALAMPAPAWESQEFQTSHRHELHLDTSLSPLDRFGFANNKGWGVRFFDKGCIVANSFTLNNRASVRKNFDRCKDLPKGCKAQLPPKDVIVLAMSVASKSVVRVSSLILEDAMHSYYDATLTSSQVGGRFLDYASLLAEDAV